MTGKPILILAFSLFAFCLGDPECSSANQCRDLWIAKKCDSVKYCIAEDWSKQKPTGNRDDVCSICLNMVKEARDQLRSNETMDELKQVFEGSCHLLVLKPAVAICDRLVDQFVPELVEMLASQMDPETVCSVARLCNNEAFRFAQKNSKDCVHCEAFVQASDRFMQSLSSEDFKNGLLEVCRSGGVFSDACSHLGLIHADFLYDLSKSVLKKKPCGATLVCPSTPSSAESESHSRPISKRKMCPLCKTVMAGVRKQLLKAKTMDEFAENMFRICEELDLANSTCSQMAQPEVYEKLKSSETLPELFCYAAYCREKPNGEIPVWPVVSASNQQRDSDLLDFLTISDSLLPQTQSKDRQPAVRPTIAYGDAIENPVFLGPVLSSKLYGEDEELCNTCNEVLETLSEPVRNDDDYLNKMFDIVCLGASNPEKCKLFMDKFSAFLTRAFAEGGVSKEMCPDLVPNCQVQRRQSSPPESCSVCLNVMKVLKDSNSSIWTPYLEKKCNGLFGNESYMCKDLSATYGRLASMLDDSTETEACSFVKLCDPSSAVKAQPLAKTSCQTCVLTIQSLVDALKNNVSDIIIESVLDSLCDLLPHAEKRLCFNVVETIGVEGFKKLIENINPSEVCTELHICHRKEEPVDVPTTAVSFTPAPVTEKSGVEKIPCKFCLMAVKMLLDQLQDDKTEDSIRKALEGLCQYFPEETKNTCKNLIDQYAESLIDMIIADFNPSEICTYLRICPTHHLIGVDDGHEKNFETFSVDTNEVRDWIEPGTQKAYEEAKFTDEKHTEEAFHQFHKVVQECALCEALVGVISRHKTMMEKDYDFSANAHRICSIVPKNKMEMCSSMLVSYGPSIVNLLRDHKIDPNEVCIYVDLCDETMQAKVNQPVSVPEPKVAPEEKNDCMRGPVFWCASPENAEKCGTFLHCQETVWKSWKTPPTRRSNSSVSD